jgi:hypothetical protein
MVRQLRDALIAAGEVPAHCAWFRSVGSEAFEPDQPLLEERSRSLVSVGAEHAPSVFRGDGPRRERIDLGYHVAVSVTEDRVSIWSDGSPRELGRLLATYRRGAFRAVSSHEGGRVDLTMEDGVNGRMFLIGTWTPFDDECLRTARAAEEMFTDDFSESCSSS